LSCNTFRKDVAIATKTRINRRSLLKTGLAAAAASSSTLGAGQAAGRTEFDCIVMGLGAIGSGALYWLSGRLGDRVLGIEQFDLGHSRGSGQDHSRATHYQYPDAALVRLAASAIETWSELEQDTGERVFVRTGGIELVKRVSEHEAIFHKVRDTVSAAGLPVEELGQAERARRFPQFRLGEDVGTLYFPETGLADANKGNAAHIAGARRNGAAILTRSPVNDIRLGRGEIEIRTGNGTFRTARLVLASGPWGERWLRELGLELPLNVYQQQVTYYSTPNLERFAVGTFPIFHYFGPHHPYGFPVYGEKGTKAGLEFAASPIDADHKTFVPNRDAERELTAWLDDWIPGYAGPVLYSKTCLVTLPEDRLCILDQVPGIPQVSFAVGAGMSYKFASLFGKIMSQLALDGQSKYDYSTITLARPS